MPEAFEEVLDSAAEYTDALEELQKQLQQGWLSISKARYALGSSALSRSMFASVGEASQIVGADESGVMFASAAERQLQGVAASRQVVSIQKDFEKAVGMAVAVANARRKLQDRVVFGTSQPEE